MVSQKSMSLDESPMAEPSLHHNAMGGSSNPTVPKRGGPRRRSIAPTAAPEPDDDSDWGFEDPQSPEKAAVGDSSKVLEMANPDRPYNQWPGKLMLTSCALAGVPLTCCICRTHWPVGHYVQRFAPGRIPARHNGARPPMDMPAASLPSSVRHRARPRNPLPGTTCLKNPRALGRR